MGVNEAGEAILEAQGLDVPARIVSTGLYAEDVPGAAAAWEALDAQAKRIDAPVLHWHLAEAGHLDVTDVPLIMPTWLARKLFGASSMGREDPEETVGAAHDAIAVFLRHALLCDAEAAPEAVGERWPILALRHTHADRRAVSADVCP